MKLLNKIKKWFRKKPPVKSTKPEEGVYFSADDLQKIMSKRISQSFGTPITGTAAKDTWCGLQLPQLLEHPPSLERRLRMIFREGKMANPTARFYYSDQETDALLVERSGVVCRKAEPTQIITQRPGYKRKVDGKYNQTLNSCGAIRTY
ncbi:MAG: hypothetical protein ACXAC5_01235 [Promethearchaeota archaeon]|jgi:hypothetical protein